MTLCRKNNVKIFYYNKMVVFLFRCTIKLVVSSYERLELFCNRLTRIVNLSGKCCFHQKATINYLKRRQWVGSNQFNRGCVFQFSSYIVGVQKYLVSFHKSISKNYSGCRSGVGSIRNRRASMTSCLNLDEAKDEI